MVKVIRNLAVLQTVRPYKLGIVSDIAIMTHGNEGS
jgi:hypothetical protein